MSINNNNNNNTNIIIISIIIIIICTVAVRMPKEHAAGQPLWPSPLTAPSPQALKYESNAGVHKGGFGKGGFSNEACFRFAR